MVERTKNMVSHAKNYMYIFFLNSYVVCKGEPSM